MMKEKVIIKKEGPYKGQVGQIDGFLGSMGMTIVLFEDEKTQSFYSHEFEKIEEMTKERAMELLNTCIDDLMVFERLGETINRLLVGGFTVGELVHYFNFDANDVLRVAQEMEEEGGNENG